MNDGQAGSAAEAEQPEKGGARKPSPSELKAQRIDELLDSCRDQVLGQIIGPFGLTPAMFEDKDGGNVTTTHNFREGVVANANDTARHAAWRQNCDSPIDRKLYDAELHDKRTAMFKAREPITSAWTGNELPRNGQMHLDHVKSVAKIEEDARANLVMSKAERVAMANAPENLVPSESNINQSMNDKDKEEWAKARSKKEPDKTNAERFGVDMEGLKRTKRTSEKHIETELFKAQFMKQGQELMVTGAREAGKNALRQATGMLLYELVNGSYVEVKRISKEPGLQEGFVDHLIQSLRNVAERIKGKFEHIFKSLVAGGVQGFLSNFLTYVINSLVTTSAKVVTVIREGLKGLVEAVRLMISPPPGMPAIEAARQATKIIAAVVTTSLGLVFEKSVEGFILSMPLLAPMSGVIAPALTAILTGIVTALVVFGLDRLFDWLNANGTEMLAARIDSMEASQELFERMAQMLQAQFDNSRHYQLCIEQYRAIEADLRRSGAYMDAALHDAEDAVESRRGTLSLMQEGLSEFKSMDAELGNLLVEYEKNKKDQE